MGAGWGQARAEQGARGQPALTKRGVRLLGLGRRAESGRLPAARVLPHRAHVRGLPRLHSARAA